MLRSTEKQDHSIIVLSSARNCTRIKKTLCASLVNKPCFTSLRKRKSQTEKRSENLNDINLNRVLKYL
jgi:hypothetical protein